MIWAGAVAWGFQWEEKKIGWEKKNVLAYPFVFQEY